MKKKKKKKKETNVSLYWLNTFVNRLFAKLTDIHVLDSFHGVAVKVIDPFYVISCSLFLFKYVSTKATLSNPKWNHLIGSTKLYLLHSPEIYANTKENQKKIKLCTRTMLIYSQFILS